VDEKLVSWNEDSAETVDSQELEENFFSQPHEMGQAQVEQSFAFSRAESPACGQGLIFCANGGQEKASEEVIPRGPEEAARWWDEVADWLRGPEVGAQEALAESRNMAARQVGEGSRIISKRPRRPRGLFKEIVTSSTGGS